MLKLSTTLAEFEPDLTKILKSLTDPSKSVVDRSLVHILLHKSTKFVYYSFYLIYITRFKSFYKRLISRKQ